MGDSTGQATSAYRYYDRNGFLIYVGITARKTRRNSEHNAHAVWWPYVVRQEVDHFPNREEALVHERALIVRYRPPFNVQHNPDAAALRAAYLTWVQADSGPATLPELQRQLGSRLPLLLWRQSDDQRSIQWRTDPCYGLLVSRLIFDTRPQQILIHDHGDRVGHVTSIETRGLFMVMTAVLYSTRARCARDAVIAFKGQNKTNSFVVKRIFLSQQPAPPRRQVASASSALTA